MNNIINLFINKGKLLGHFEFPCTVDIGFDIDDFRSLINKLNKEKILIQYIELFDKKTNDFYPVDFSYQNKINLKQNIVEVNDFLFNLKGIKLKNYNFTIHFDNNNLEKK